jgi:hypothetical protein
MVMEETALAGVAAVLFALCRLTDETFRIWNQADGGRRRG